MQSRLSVPNRLPPGGPAAPRTPFFDSSEPGLGVLRPREGREKFRLLRYDPSPKLAGFVRHYWTVEWDLTDAEPYRQDVVPNPCVNLVIEPGRTFGFPPSPSRFSKPLSGQGRVFGVKFRPGGFYPFYRESLAELDGRPIPVDRIIAASGAELERALAESDDSGMVALLDRLLLDASPVMDAETALLHDMTRRIAEDRELTKVDGLCAAFDIEKRTLQRLFSRRIGLAPKWVIRLHRLQEAADALERGGPNGSRPILLDLSHELGYHDQAHFIKDFKAVVGVTPEAYAQRARLGAER
ncbi:AraC family transcriptional regulator [Saccharibacillus alkalitolerans]|uniref:AraC family transcriptional regulator n=1 Tax=Saccharibacillus alkalitolerans TaxID=2705290 RepID=A0ABX0FCG5_9BACL|nr:helix-turn-helix domain-containing protein [Saccharibacillus alkalitolerans]NGZ77268.1 AraC family transcriptional regulator [Saccharibacillus alkalitolerans]